MYTTDSVEPQTQEEDCLHEAAMVILGESDEWETWFREEERAQIIKDDFTPQIVAALAEQNIRIDGAFGKVAEGMPKLYQVSQNTSWKILSRAQIIKMAALG